MPAGKLPGFRFGLLSELELPWDADLEPLETAVDQATVHLFYGRDSQARNALNEVSPQYPCVRGLLESLPLTNKTSRPANESGKLAPPPVLVTGETPRILLIAHVSTLRDRMDKSNYYRYEALCRRPGVTLFGPGIAGYEPGMTLDNAVRVACGGIWPNVILHGGDLKDSGVPLVTGLDRSKTLTAIELLDSWARPELSVDFIRRQRFAIGLMQHAGPHLEYYRQHCPQTEFFWASMAVRTDLFRDYGLRKEYDVILYGVLESTIYPLRTRLAKMLANAPDIRFRHIKHPGYYPDQESLANQVVAGAALGREINQSWIGIATCSVYHQLLMKYLEIPACHAAVAGNLPDWCRPFFQDSIIELREEQSDETILATLRSHLADKDRLRSLTEKGHSRVVRDFSTNAFADRVMQIFGEALARRIGARSGGPAKQ